MRDDESALTAMRAAGAGRIVHTTMHGRNAAGIVTALRSLGLPDYEIAASLALVVAKRLIRKLCESCKEQGQPTDDERRWLKALGAPCPENVWRAVGCKQCDESGYHDRTGIFEMLPVDERFYDMILAGEDEHHLRRHLRESGHRLLLQDGLEKAPRGITDPRELRRIGLQSYPDAANTETAQSQTT